MTNLFGWSDQFWLWLDQFGIVVGDIMLILSLAGIIYGFLRRNSLRNWLSRNRFPSIGGIVGDKHWQGVIFTVSRSEVPLWVISQVQPVTVGLLTTRASQTEGDTIYTHAEQHNMAVIMRTIEDPDDPAEVNQKTKDLLRAMRERNITSIAVDITGGKTPMSLGAFMAAEESGCDTIYVTTEMKDRKPNMSTAKIIAISQTGQAA